MVKTGESKNIVDALEGFSEDRINDIHTVIPAKIEKYSGHDEKRAVVKPLINLIMKNGGLVSIPPIADVPIIFSSSSSFELLFPLKKGDGCLLLFSEVGIGNFLKNKNKESDADDYNKFGLQDAIAIPGLWSFNGQPSESVKIEVSEAGLFTIKNQVQSLATLMSSLITEIKDIITTGTAATQTISPATKLLFEALQLKFDALLEDN